MYNREAVYEYAKKWAYGRNPKYYNFDPVGGDCTNFVSQCIYAGCGQMNYNRNNGWYYIDGNNKSPSWTGVEFLYSFLATNNNLGPKGEETTIDKLGIGDVVQLSFNGQIFSLKELKYFSFIDLNSGLSFVYFGLNKFFGSNICSPFNNC